MRDRVLPVCCISLAELSASNGENNAKVLSGLGLGFDSTTEPDIWMWGQVVKNLQGPGSGLIGKGCTDCCKIIMKCYYYNKKC